MFRKSEMTDENEKPILHNKEWVSIFSTHSLMRQTAQRIFLHPVHPATLDILV